MGVMDTNQTINFKPVYSRSHTNLYNAPVINTTMPNFAIASGLNLVSTAQTNGGNQESDSFNALATLQTSNSLLSSSAAQLVPMTSSPVCLNNHLQQMPAHHQHFITNHHNSIKNAIQLKTISPPAQIILTTPHLSNLSSSNSTSNNGNDSSFIDTCAIKTSPCHNPINNVSSKSSNRPVCISRNGSSSSNPRSSDSSISSLGVGNSKNSDSIDFVDLARASCSNMNVGVRTLSSNSSFSPDLDDKMGSSTGKGFKCRVCDRYFTQKGNLKTHLMTHSGEKPYVCQTCGKNFTQKGNLDTHVKIHTETKDHKCSFCDRGFTQRGNLKTHIRSVHTKEKPYACGHCGKAFSQKGNMLTHFRTHDKDARFPCDVCGKTFSQKGNLKTHQQRHGRRPGR